MPQHLTILRCSQRTATFLLIIIGACFILAGCAQLYKTIGLSPNQVAAQVAADQDSTQILVHAVRTTTTEIITTAIAGLGAICTGILGKWLGTERKITTAIIRGVENNPTGDVKESIQAVATAAGIEKKLHARVKALT